MTGSPGSYDPRERTRALDRIASLEEEAEALARDGQIIPAGMARHTARLLRTLWGVPA